MEFINEYISVIVMLTCLCLGYIVKYAIPTKKIDRFIPLIVGVVGIGINVWANMAVSPQIILVGLVSGLSSTGLYEAFHQFIHRKE